MRKIKSITNEFKEISKMRTRIERELKTPDDIERAYEGLFLYIVTKFENHLEMIFFLVIKEKVKGRKGYTIKPSNDFSFKKSLPENEIIAYILGEKSGKNGYLDWLKIKDIDERASRYLYQGRPFSDILNDQSVKDVFNKIGLIRNYIAHKSSNSYDKLKKEIGVFSSLYAYLSSNHSNGITFFDYIIRELSGICSRIHSKFDI